jgi:hypothetical protein
MVQQHAGWARVIIYEAERAGASNTDTFLTINRLYWRPPMADYDRTTDPSSAQSQSLLEIVDDVLARHKTLEILREKYFQLRCERGPSTYLTTELTRHSVPGLSRTEPIDETERRTR